MREITSEDFKIYTNREQMTGRHFCGNCDNPVTSSDCCEDGYTHCCNEPAISRENFLKAGLIISIDNYLEEISTTPNEYRMYQENKRPFRQVLVTPTKPYDCDNPSMFSFEYSTVDSLVNTINSKLKK